MSELLNSEQISQLHDIVRKAGAAIMEIYAQEIEVETKADDSPLTKADLAAHRVLVEGLTKITPEIPILSEEGEQASFEERQSWHRYWLIDPLDGTKEFINRNGEFTVNVALIEGNQSILGVVGVPVQDLLYYGDVRRGVAERYAPEGMTLINGRQRVETDVVTVVASRSHGGERLETYLQELQDRLGEVSRTPVGSSLKLCILAEGQADIYPRLGPTSEWDIAAAHAVLAAAGGDLWAVGAQDLPYNSKESVLNPEFIAVSDRSYPWHEKLPAVPAP